MNQTCYLVIGGEGFLGESIVTNLRMLGKSVITTLLNTQNEQEPCIYLDLSTDITFWEVPKNVEVAFFCSAITSIDECRLHSEESKMINVDNTIALSSKLVREGASIIFPSTNLVFDGRMPNMKIDDPVCPCTEYGRQKAAAESGLMSLGQNVAIVRFTKIFGPQTPFIRNWIKQLKDRKVIHPFSDMFLSPVSIDFALKVLIEVADRKSFGIWHVSANEDITYENLARHLARKIGVSQQYVQPTTVNGSGLEFESIPKHTTLDTSRIENELGFIVPKALDAIDSLFGLEHDTSE